MTPTVCKVPSREGIKHQYQVFGNTPKELFSVYKWCQEKWGSEVEQAWMYGLEKRVYHQFSMPDGKAQKTDQQWILVLYTNHDESASLFESVSGLVAC
jgi:hypothetical protein